MELTLLRRLVDRLADELVGRRFGQAWALPPWHLAIAVGSRAAPRLWFSTEPETPHLYLRRGGHPTPARPPAFAMALRKQARGRRVESISLLGGDRIVELRWRGADARLILELIPRRATAMVVAEDATVVSVWTPRRGRPEPGSPYLPPSRSERTPLSELTAADWQELESAASAGGLARAILQRVDGSTSLVVREVRARIDAGQPLREALAEEIERSRDADDEPVVYAPVAPESLRRLPDGNAFELAPYELLARKGAPELRFGDLMEAAAFYYPTRARLALLDRARAQISDAAARQRTRAQRALGKLRRAPASQTPPERLRQLGDLLLAHPDARPREGVVTVPDLYVGGEAVAIEVDPEGSLRDSADRYYRRAQRLERKAEQDAARRRTLEGEQARLEQLERRAAAMTKIDELKPLIEDARKLGLELRPHALREPEAEGAPTFEQLQDREPDSIPGVLRVATSKGAEILVGRSATGNDRLTHEIASRHDWWLHAVGPGSHVVLRNPEQLEEPRPEALVAAARLAAWFSRARGATKVEVHWTRVGHVRRPRGGRPGQVLMERYRDILVEPAPPATIARGEG